MLSLIYVSSASRELSDADLLALLETSRDRNNARGITGILLFDDGNFLQVLEGPDDDVRSLYQVISADQRHHGVILLSERHIEERQFPGWSMAFRNLRDPAVRSLPGFNEFLNQPSGTPSPFADKDRSLRLIDTFRRNMRRS